MPTHCINASNQKTTNGYEIPTIKPHRTISFLDELFMIFDVSLKITTGIIVANAKQATHATKTLQVQVLHQSTKDFHKS